VGFEADLRVTIRVSLDDGSPAAALASAERAVRGLAQRPLGRVPTGGIEPAVEFIEVTETAMAGALEPFEVDGEEVTGPDDFCRTCGAVYRGFGDGWNGECPDCADRTFASQEADGG
jgi:hypothetical protein